MLKAFSAATRSLWVLVVAIILGYLLAGYVAGEVAIAAARDELPRPDWWDLVVGVLGAIVGWITRWLQDLASRRPPGGGILPPDR
jgi:H+/Cl- antiporter ClcA